MPTQTVDDSEVFLDTSVLVDFVQKGSNADCFDIFGDRPCRKRTSPFVKEEYTRKRDNRRYIVRKFLEQIGQDKTDFSDFDLPHKDNFSDSDNEYAIELLTELASGTPMEARRELDLRRKLFMKGNNVLFDDDLGQVDIYNANLDAHLMGNLQGPVMNDDDRHVIAGAADWAENEDKETVISEDRREFISKEEEINAAISLTPGFDCELCMYTSSAFLKATDPSVT